MPLAPGTRLGSYEVVAAIGAGGMGEVYRARDAKLHREVAIKVLPERLGLDPGALARFEREAQAVASLSHPNILAIHDFGVSGELAYAVTELLEGESLRAKIASGALPPRKAVEIALQIVQGIAAAHGTGIVHRDLKPENIFLTEDGRVKILDFGLSKVAAFGGDGSALQTQTGLGTSPGTVMGTVGYMSPEQVRGLPVDHRTDIFSFGVVLYEMLSGVRAFRGDSGVETMNAILKDDPPELSGSGRTVPVALERIVRRCLEKNPVERFHSAHDLGLALESVSGVGTSGSATSMTASADARGKARAWSWPRLLAGVALVVLGVAAGFLAGREFGAAARAKPPRFDRLTFRRGEIHSARFAGDGKTVVYSATLSDEPKRLYSMQEGSPESLALAYPNADIAAVSSSGELALVMDRRQIQSFARVGTLARASLSGGAARAVLEDVQDADWLPDGSGLAAARYVNTRYRLDFPIGKTVYETAGYISDVRVSPDGQTVAFVDHPIFGDDGGAIAVVDRAGKKRTLSDNFPSAQGVAWTPDGEEVWYTASEFASARTLFAATLDGISRAISRVSGNLRLADIDADGGVLLWQENPRIGILARAPGDSVDRDLSWLDWSTLPKLSADGRTLVFTEVGDGGGKEYSVFLRPTDGGPAVRLGAGVAAALSPDGKWVLTQRMHPTPAQYVLLPTGAGETRELTRDALSHTYFGTFVRGGTHIAFSAHASGHRSRVYLQNLAGGAAQPITPEGITGLPSPDGTTVAFEGQLYMGAAPPRPIHGILAKDELVGWSTDSRSLFVRQILEAGGQRVFRLDLASGRRTLLHEIARVLGAKLGPWFTITPDGSAYAFTYDTKPGDLYRVTGLK